MPRKLTRIDAVGKKFGKWTVLEDDFALWRVQCECGYIKDVRRDYLIRGLSKACISCAQKSHGKEGSRIYNIWAGMKQRCSNPEYHAYADYGGRGITVCQRWQTFENFYADMGEPPKGKTLGRRDNDGAYSPKNCRWETRTQQQRNRRNTSMMMWKGELRSVAQIAEEHQMPIKLVRNRLAVGWSIEKAVSTPSRKEQIT